MDGRGCIPMICDAASRSTLRRFTNARAITVEEKLTSLGADLAEPVRESIVLINELSKELRTLSHLLHPPLLDEAGFPSAIRWFVGGFVERSQVKVDFELDPNLGRLSRESETAISSSYKSVSPTFTVMREAPRERPHHARRTTM